MRWGFGTDSGEGDFARAEESAARSKEEDLIGADPIGGCLDVPLARVPALPYAPAARTPERPGCEDARPCLCSSNSSCRRR